MILNIFKYTYICFISKPPFSILILLLDLWFIVFIILGHFFQNYFLYLKKILNQIFNYIKTFFYFLIIIFYTLITYFQKFFPILKNHILPFHLIQALNIKYQLILKNISFLNIFQ